MESDSYFRGGFGFRYSEKGIFEVIKLVYFNFAFKIYNNDLSNHSTDGPTECARIFKDKNNLIVNNFFASWSTKSCNLHEIPNKTFNHHEIFG